jgi:RimJ/RimL family protein N-acetyltransferase
LYFSVIFFLLNYCILVPIRFVSKVEKVITGVCKLFVHCREFIGEILHDLKKVRPFLNSTTFNQFLSNPSHTMLPIVLQDQRVQLTPLTMKDYESLLPFALHEPGLWDYSPWPIAGAENFRQYLSIACKGFETGESLPFVVYDKSKNIVAGSTRFYDIQEKAKAVQLGYTWYGKDFQGTGINAHCKYLMLQFAFETWQMERVEFRADARNAQSIAAMKKIGCVEEGILRSAVPSNLGGRRNTMVLSILKQEWQSSVKAKLIKMM